MTAELRSRLSLKVCERERDAAAGVLALLLYSGRNSLWLITTVSSYQIIISPSWSNYTATGANLNSSKWCFSTQWEGATHELSQRNHVDLKLNESRIKIK